MRILGALALFLASVSFRGLPMFPYFGASGAKTKIPNTVFPGNMRILSTFILFLASVRFRDLRGHHWDSGASIYVGASGTETRCPDAVFARNIRILVALSLLLAPNSFRGHPLWPYLFGRLVRQSEVQTRYLHEISGL